MTKLDCQSWVPLVPSARASSNQGYSILNALTLFESIALYEHEWEYEKASFLLARNLLPKVDLSIL